MPTTSKPVELAATDGVKLRGEVVGEGDLWAILVHDVGEDLDVWRPMREELVGAGFRVMSIDLRGHGVSEGDWSPETAIDDLQVAVRHARGQDARAVYLVGAGQSATAAMIAAADEPVQAIVCLSPMAELPGIDAARIRISRAPKFLLVGALDEQAMANAQTVYRKLIGWRVLESRALTEQGTDLLVARGNEHVFEKTIAFLRDYPGLSAS